MIHKVNKAEVYEICMITSFFFFFFGTTLFTSSLACAPSGKVWIAHNAIVPFSLSTTTMMIAVLSDRLFLWWWSLVVFISILFFFPTSSCRVNTGLCLS